MNTKENIRRPTFFILKIESTSKILQKTSLHKYSSYYDFHALESRLTDSQITFYLVVQGQMAHLSPGSLSTKRTKWRWDVLYSWPPNVEKNADSLCQITYSFMIIKPIYLNDVCFWKYSTLTNSKLLEIYRVSAKVSEKVKNTLRDQSILVSSMIKKYITS